MKPVRLFLTICCLLFLSGLGACTSPELLDTGQSISIARIDDKTYVTSDGEKLAMSAWQARAPEAVYVAVHGFNEYAADFRLPAPWFAERGISVYGYDQRGFGRTPDSRRGKWAGGDVMASDLTTFVRLIRQRHPGLPVHVVGTSMG
ncbi:MAG: alpha/beta hydrolase, partial [Anderseniella sp.]